MASEVERAGRGQRGQRPATNRWSGGAGPSAPVASSEPNGSSALRERRVTTLDVAMLGTLLFLIACHLISAALRAGWVSAAASVGLTSALLLLCAVPGSWRPVVGRLLLFGLVAGVCELFTDWSGERVVHSLSYPPGEPMLWASPVYMPFSWMVVLTQIGYLAWRLAGLAPRPPRWAAMLLTGLWGALNIPFYEEMAYRANWWRYTLAPGLGHTPFYVMLFEGLIAAALPLALAGIETHTPRAVALRGLLIGAWIPWAALIAWLLLGR